MSRTAAPSAPWGRTLAIWAALVALLGITLWVAYLPIGRWTTILGLAIAGAKAALVAIWYMELDRAKPLVRLAALAGCVLLLVLFALTFADVLTRPS